MSPHCNNCGEHITAQYVRVFYPNEKNIAGCPYCRGFDAMLNGKEWKK